MGGENKISKGLIIGVVTGLAVIVIAVAAFLIIGKVNKKEAEPEENKKAVVTADNVEEVVEDFIKDEGNVIVPRSYTVTQNSEWHFPDGNSESTDAYVENVGSNETPVYFDVLLEDGAELVYSSPILELGASISNFQLDKPLSAGTYEAVLEYHLVDDNQNTLTTVQVGVTLIIEG